MKKGKARVPVEEIEQKLPAHIKLDRETYRGSHSKARFIDEDYGEFWSIVRDVVKGKGEGHPKRKAEAGRQRRSITLQEALRRLPEEPRLVRSTYVAMSKNATFIDKDFGEFEATPKRIIKGSAKHRQRQLLEGTAKNLTIEEVKAKLPAFVKIVEETYTRVCKRATFIDEDFGEFVSSVNDVVFHNRGHRNRGFRQRAQTCMDKYGVSHPSKVASVHAKQQRSMSKTKPVAHWRTGVKVSCRGSYEYATVNWLNENRIDFDFQIPFVLASGSTYYCDFYLKEDDLYVEVKGWWMQDISREKWEEFHESHPNSELWTREVLRSKGMKVK
jgi:hypothetical protein